MYQPNSNYTITYIYISRITNVIQAGKHHFEEVAASTRHNRLALEHCHQDSCTAQAARGTVEERTAVVASSAESTALEARQDHRHWAVEEGTAEDTASRAVEEVPRVVDVAGTVELEAAGSKQPR